MRFKLLALLICAVRAAPVVNRTGVFTSEVRFVTLENSVVEFVNAGLAVAYDGRGGRTDGTLTDGAFVLGDVPLPAIKFFKDPADEEIYTVGLSASGMSGRVDFETGQADVQGELFFDFTPALRRNSSRGHPHAHHPRRRLMQSVAFDFDTEQSAGGLAMRLDGAVRLGGEVELPATGDDDLDRRYGLPGRVRFELEGRLDVAEGWPTVKRCPAGGSPVGGFDLPIFLKASLSQLVIGAWPQMAYDPSYGGIRSGGSGLIDGDSFEGGKARFSIAKEGTKWAPLYIVPAAANQTYPAPPGDLADSIWVEIELVEDMEGEIDFCTGSVKMSFDAAFTAKLLEIPMGPALDVITELVTSESTGLNNTVYGTPFDGKGDGFLVGVAIVPPTGDFLIDLMLSLPSDAVTEMPVHLGFACRSWSQIQRQVCDERQ